MSIVEVTLATNQYHTQALAQDMSLIVAALEFQKICLGKICLLHELPLCITITSHVLCKYSNSEQDNPANVDRLSFFFNLVDRLLT